MSQGSPIPAPTDIAIIGLACRLPGADGPEQLWRNLREGVESISFLTEEELREAGVPPAVSGAPNYVRAHGVLEGSDLFDAGFFGYAPREAEVIDPQQRLFLECAWEALESAGYDPSRAPRETGVFAGGTMSGYLLALHPHRDRLEAIGIDTNLLAVGNDKDSLAPRVAYKLDLRGPAVTVQTACSTSLVAVHMACQSLLAGETDLALAGAVSATVPMKSGYLHQEGGILSPDGHCRSFDARAAGTVFGCGLGIVVLKRLTDALADGDTIQAVIKGSAVNNDGASKAGFTAPSVPGQAEVIAEALANAGLPAGAIGMLEAHGTATALGDPVEVAALTRVFRRDTQRAGFCALGSIKTNIGHLEAAAGIAGLLKAVLAVREGEIPPSLHFERPNPQIDFEGSPFFVPTGTVPFPPGPRRAGVSSFGFGGTNAHVVVEEPPAPEPAATPRRPWQLLALSARSAPAVGEATARLARHFAEHPETALADAAWTLQTGRQPLEHRRALACRTAAETREGLADPGRLAAGVFDGRERQVCFLFPGQGAQHPGMARELFRGEPAFREEIERCAALFAGHLDLDVDLATVLDPGPDAPADLADRLVRTGLAQPALFAVEVALTRLLASWGIRPRALLGHSLGEYVAAHLAGVLSLEDAVALVAARARLMAGLPPGDMVAVPLAETELEPLLGADLSIAAVHGPGLCVASGPPAAVERLMAALAERGVEGGKLHISHAFHSAMMDPILPAFEAEVRKVRLQAPRLPFVSNVTGRWITAAEATDPAYWARQLRATVRLGDGLGALLGRPGATLLEVGPAQALSGAARQHPARTPAHAILATLPHPKDPRDAQGTLLQAVGGLWAAGVEVDWPALHEGERRRRVPLPSYPFERRRYWIDVSRLPNAAAAVPASLPAPAPAPAPTPAASYVDTRYAETSSGYVAPANEIEEILADIWQILLGVERVGSRDNFFRLNGNSLIALQAISRIQAVFGVKLSVRSFFEQPTVAELAALVAARQPSLEALTETARLLAEVQAALPAPAPPPAVEVPPPVAAGEGDGEGMRFSLFFFSGSEEMVPGDKYRLIVESARFADRHGFTAVWTPERHFHSFGGLYPNPAVLASALAMVTERLELRAGSVVPSLHHPVRLAEDWSVVDNLSHGRVGLSFASGFHPNDFVFAPDGFATRREEMWERIATVRRLWRGETVKVRGGAGNEIEVAIFPKPARRELPVWITCSNTQETFEEAGRIGANVLTSLIGLTLDKLAERIGQYRASRARHGLDPAAGQVAAMIHTYVGPDLKTVKEKVRGPFCDYLRSHTALLTSLAKSLHKGFAADAIAPADLEELLEMEFERYFQHGSLLGTPESCLAMVRRLREIGVDEVGCLLDFGVDVPAVLASLQHLDELRRLSAREAVLAG
ncbi:MAG TPA: MupA/Atu3671 family FMN-dependent luciferase-like monooxygenase [Thermoanaerobaculia bacterium]|jgi:natural product biosynthesis luciferase-like monooxygenase protein